MLISHLFDDDKDTKGIHVFSTFCIMISRLPLSEDPALAMAFSVARRAAAVPMLLVNGTFRRNVRSYLDSSLLQHQLQRLSDHASLKGSHFFISQIFLIQNLGF